MRRNQGLAIINKSGQFGTYLNTQDWMGGTDLYIGIKYLDITDTVYGWIRVNCPAFYTCILKDYSFSKCVNSSSLTLASSSNSICASETATISAMGATTYTWSTGETNQSDCCESWYNYNLHG